MQTINIFTSKLSLFPSLFATEQTFLFPPLGRICHASAFKWTHLTKCEVMCICAQKLFLIDETLLH